MARRTSQGVVDGGSTLPSGTAQPDLPPVEAWGKSNLDHRPAKSRSPNGEWSSTLPSPRRSAQLIRATRCSEAKFPASLTSPIRPAVPEFSPGKSLSGKERRRPKRRKSAVVPTKSILTAANVPIIGGHHVLALQSSREDGKQHRYWSVVENTRVARGARGAAARAVPG